MLTLDQATASVFETYALTVMRRKWSPAVSVLETWKALDAWDPVFADEGVRRRALDVMNGRKSRFGDCR
jgi:hypothetical protein